MNTFHYDSRAIVAAVLLTPMAAMTGAPAPILAADQPGLEVIEVRKIWDRAPHNAFTDLVRYKDAWWCVFREGQKHVSPDGALRVITSRDGKDWESAALLTSKIADLRDAKITVTPDGKLMLVGAGAMHEKMPVRHQTYAWFSTDGKTWSEPAAIGDANLWLWRVTWTKDVAFGIGYHTTAPRFIRLYRSTDGIHFPSIVDDLKVEGAPGETSILFREGGTALCLLRRDPESGMLGIAKSPYTNWTWRDLGTRIGGPHLIELQDGRLLAAVRFYDKPVRTSLCWLDAEAGKLTEALKLPSGGDTSYAGLVLHDGLLWVSYYSSHESKTSIYLARVKIGSKKMD